MDTRAHVRLIAILHLAHGFVAAASAIGLLFVFGVLTGFKVAVDRWVFPLPHGGTAEDPELWVWGGALVLVAIYAVGALIFTVPALAGGYGMLKRKRWARKLVLVSAVVAALNFPLGTALAVYTFWFLLGDGREIWEAGDGRSPAT